MKNVKICSRFTHEKFNALDIIIKEGDISNDKMYIIASGK
jgi:hypothetical protein